MSPLPTIESLVARRVRMVGFDIDGVMTDAGVYVGHVGGVNVELKRFDLQDGVGIKLLRTANIKVVVVSGRVSHATTIRAEELGVDEVVQDDLARKRLAFDDLVKRFDVRYEECAFLGDDLPDLPVLRRVGLPAAVRNAVPEVLDIAQFVTHRTGGNGAVREFCEALLRARNEWEDCVEQYLVQRGETSARLSGVLPAL